MSAGRGTTAVGAGRGRGRGAGRGANLPAGVSYEDVVQASQNRAPAPLYPEFTDLPILTNLTEREKLVCKYQMGFAERLRKSPYFLVDTTKVNRINQVSRYSDKYATVSATKRPTLDKTKLDPQFFPKSIWDGYFDASAGRSTARKVQAADGEVRPKLDLDELEKAERRMLVGDADAPLNEVEMDEEGQPEDFDVDDVEYGDDDYVNNYFDDGEGDGDDVGGGDDDGGGE